MVRGEANAQVSRKQSIRFTAIKESALGDQSETASSLERGMGGSKSGKGSRLK